MKYNKNNVKNLLSDIDLQQSEYRDIAWCLNRLNKGQQKEWLDLLSNLDDCCLLIEIKKKKYSIKEYQLQETSGGWKVLSPVLNKVVDYL